MVGVSLVGLSRWGLNLGLMRLGTLCIVGLSGWLCNIFVLFSIF